MFNKTIIIPTRAPSHVSHTHTVHEHRAPTDKSVELLKEMEDAARSKVIESIVVEGNHFKCVIHTYKDAISARDVMRVIFDLNGKRLEVEESVGWDSDRRELVLKIRDTLARCIANEVLEQSLERLRCP